MKSLRHSRSKGSEGANKEPPLAEFDGIDDQLSLERV
jgi:hypothetical protein